MSPETRQRVLDAIDHLNYTVNAGARALATARTMTIGLVLQFHNDQFTPAMSMLMVNIADAAREQGYRILLLTDQDGVEAVREATTTRSVDGLILLNVVESDPRLVPIRSSTTPAVLIGMPSDTRGIDAVDLDFAEAANLMVDALADDGHSNVTFICWPDSVYETGATFAQRFRNAALTRAEERNLSIESFPVDTDPSRARHQLKTLFRTHAPQATLVHNDSAVALLPLIMKEEGVQTKVISLHSRQLASTFQLPFDGVESSPVEVAHTAVEALVKRLREPGAEHVRVLHPPVFEAATPEQ